MKTPRITYKMIGKYIGQGEQNMKDLKTKNPRKLNLYRYGLIYMVENELITIEELKENITPPQ